MVVVVLGRADTTHAGDTQVGAEDIRAADTHVVRGAVAVVGAVVVVVELQKQTCCHPLKVTLVGEET